MVQCSLNLAWQLSYPYRFRLSCSCINVAYNCHRPQHSHVARARIEIAVQKMVLGSRPPQPPPAAVHPWLRWFSGAASGPDFGLWPEARPRVFPGWQTAPGGREVAVWPCAAAAEAGVKSHGLVTCAIYPCALAGPGQGQGYAGARVRVTFSRIGTAARSLDPVLLHPGFWENGSIPQKKRHTFF